MGANLNKHSNYILKQLRTQSFPEPDGPLSWRLLLGLLAAEQTYLEANHFTFWQLFARFLYGASVDLNPDRRCTCGLASIKLQRMNANKKDTLEKLNIFKWENEILIVGDGHEVLGELPNFKIFDSSSVTTRFYYMCTVKILCPSVLIGS